MTDEQRVTFDRILRAQRHLLRLINDVLNLARIEAGRVEYAKETVGVASLVESVMPMVEPQMAAGELTAQVSVDPTVSVMADRDKVVQVLINLLTNAVKFTPRGGSITVETSTATQHVTISVRDTGIGIPAPKLASVFEPFVQVETSESARREGTGLGLAISRDLARGMGGDLTATSQPGLGSTFSLRLPRA